MKRVISFVALACILASSMTVFARTWTDQTGQFQVEAELVAVRDGKAYLEKTDGTVISVPLDQLSDADQEYLASLPEYKDLFESASESNSEPTEPLPEAGEYRRFEEMGWGVESLAFSPDGRFLAAGKMDKAIYVFDIEAGRKVVEIEDLEGLGQVTALAFSPDGTKLLSGGYTGRIQIWDVSDTGQLTEAERFVGHSGEINAITVSQDGKLVLSGGGDKKVCCWTLDDAREQFSIDGFKGDVKATFITQGVTQGLASDGDVVALIDMEKGEVIQQMEIDERSTQFVTIAPDGSLVALSDTYNILAWDIKSGEGQPEFEDREIQWFGCFTPNGRYLLSGGRGKVNLWDVSNSRKIYEFDTADALYVQTLACSQDNRFLAAIPSAAGQDLQVFRLPPEVYSEE